MLKLKFSDYKTECGTDEAGRGCLAGPVTAAAVILKNDFLNNDINDSKKISKKNRYRLKDIIEKKRNRIFLFSFVSKKKLMRLIF